MSAAYIATEWATVLRCSGPDERLRPVIPEGRMFSSPYLEPAAIVEGETGQSLEECFACGAFREGVRDTLIECWRTKDKSGPSEWVPFDLCAACRQQRDV